MATYELIALAIVEGLKMVLRLTELLTSSARVDPQEARAEIARIMSDVKLDEAIERRQFERLRAARESSPDDPTRV